MSRIEAATPKTLAARLLLGFTMRMHPKASAIEIGALERLAVPKREVLRLPAGTRGGAARAMEAIEELVGKRRVARGEIVPIARVNIVDTFEDAKREGLRDAHPYK